MTTALQTPEDPSIPHNAVTGRYYSEKNTAELEACGYEDRRWAGYGQWQKAGRQVKKGEGACWLLRMVPVKDKTKKVKVGKDGKPVLAKKFVKVFNWEQTEDKAVADARRAAEKAAA